MTTWQKTVKLIRKGHRICYDEQHHPKVKRMETTSTPKSAECRVFFPIFFFSSFPWYTRVKYSTIRHFQEMSFCLLCRRLNVNKYKRERTKLNRCPSSNRISSEISKKHIKRIGRVVVVVVDILLITFYVCQQKFSIDRSQHQQHNFDVVAWSSSLWTARNFMDFFFDSFFLRNLINISLFYKKEVFHRCLNFLFLLLLRHQLELLLFWFY